MTRSRTFRQLLCLAAFAPITMAHASWIPNGVQVSPAPGSRPALVPDGSGGVLIGWNGDGVRVQRLTGEGDVAPGWPLEGVIVGPPSAESRSVALEPNGDGGAWVVWTTVDHVSVTRLVRSIHIQRITGAGTTPGIPAGGIEVSTSRGVNHPLALTSDGTGGLVLLGTSSNFDCVEGYCNPPAPYTWVTRVLANGMFATGWPFELAQNERRHGFVARDPLSPTLLVGTGGSTNVHATRLTLDGELAPGWTSAGVPVVVASAGPDNFSHGPDGSGGMFLAWRDYRNGPAGFGFDIFAQHVLANGEVAAGWQPGGVSVAANAIGEQQHARIVSDGADGAFVAWQDLRSGTWKLYVLHLSPSGVPEPGWSANGNLLASTAGAQDGHSIVSDGLGGVVIAWLDHGSSPEQIRVQRLRGDGSRAPGWTDDGAPITDTPSIKSAAEAVAVAPGDAIVVWSEVRSTLANLFAQRTVADGITSALISIAGIQAFHDRAELRWYAPLLRGPPLRIERSDDGARWDRMANIEVEESGYASFVDRSVHPGRRYGYRMIGHDGDREILSPEAWIDIARPPPFGIIHVQPNPTRGGFDLSLNLDDVAAQLQIVDVAGRVVHVRELRTTAAGPLRMTVYGGHPLPGGVYTIRLLGSRSIDSRKIVVVP